MRRPLTPRQAQWYEVLVELIHERGRPPTLRELAASMGSRHPNAAVDTLRALEKKGWVEVGRVGKSRAIRLVGQRCRHCNGLGVVS